MTKGVLRQKMLGVDIFMTLTSPPHQPNSEGFRLIIHKDEQPQEPAAEHLLSINLQWLPHNLQCDAKPVRVNNL
jgi:hypothetical protein